MKKMYFSLLVICLALNLRPAITSVGPLLSILRNELGLSGLSSSLLTTLPVFCMGLFALLAVKLARRFTLEKSLLIAMLFVFSSLFSRFFATTSLSLILSALVAGLGIGIIGPLIAGLIKKYDPDNPYLMSFYSVFMVIGAALAASFSIPFYNNFQSNWRLSLGTWSVLALLGVFMLIPLLMRPLPSTRASKNLKKTTKPWTIMLFFALMAAVFYSLTAWLANFALSIGFSQKEAGLLLTFFTVIQIPISFLIPWLVNKLHQQKLFLLICSLMEFIGLVLLIIGFSPWVATIFLGIGAGGLFPLALLLSMNLSKNADEAVALNAFMQSGGFMFASLGPLIFGWGLDFFTSFTPSLLFVALLSLLMMGTIFKLPNDVSRL